MSGDTPEDPIDILEIEARAKITQQTLEIGEAITEALAGKEVKVWACIILTEEGFAAVSGGENPDIRGAAQLLAAQMVDQIGSVIAAMRLTDAEPAGEA